MITDYIFHNYKYGLQLCDAFRNDVVYWNMNHPITPHGPAVVLPEIQTSHGSSLVSSRVPEYGQLDLGIDINSQNVDWQKLWF